MDAAKIRLSPEEAALVKRSDWILTKNTVMTKTRLLLESIIPAQQDILQSLFQSHPAVAGYTAKVSRGENYRGLPYLVLDHPRCFDRDDIFAIRTMFWWGHFFSVTLHLGGIYQKNFKKKLLQSFDMLRADHFYICIDTDPWQYHFEEDYYRSLQEMNAGEFETALQAQPFLKLATRLSFDQWEAAETELLRLFGQIVNILD